MIASSKCKSFERTLQIYDLGTDVQEVDLAFEDSPAGAWDQFPVHEQATSLESTYDEHDYTT
jgi:PAB1-binding protein PBP1